MNNHGLCCLKGNYEKVQKIANIFSEAGSWARFGLSINTSFIDKKEGLRLLFNKKATQRYLSRTSTLRALNTSFDIVVSSASFKGFIYEKGVWIYKRLR